MTIQTWDFTAVSLAIYRYHVSYNLLIEGKKIVRITQCFELKQLGRLYVAVVEMKPLILKENNIAWEIHLEITSFDKEGLKSPDEFHDAEPLGYEFAKRVGAMDWKMQERHECCMYSLT